MFFRVSREWQDWCSLLLGIWVFVSPELLQFTDDPVATRTIATVGFLVIVAEVFTFSALRKLEEWINLALGILLIALPLMLDITSLAAKADSVVSGLLLVLLSLYEIWGSTRPGGQEVST